MKQSKFKTFIEDMYGHNDLSDEEKDMIDNLARLSQPEAMSREEYEFFMNDIFDGNSPLDAHDKLDIKDMVRKAEKHMPKDCVESLIESSAIQDIEDDALVRAKSYHPASLAMGVSDAIYEATDVRVHPTALLPDSVSSNAIALLDRNDDSYNDSYENSSEEDDTVYDDDTEFDDDEDYDY